MTSIIFISIFKECFMQLSDSTVPMCGSNRGPRLGLAFAPVFSLQAIAL
jgi:hypothetical protein